MTTRAAGLEDRLAQERRIEISVIGRKSGRRISLPVWFVLEGKRASTLARRGPSTFARDGERQSNHERKSNHLYLLPVNGSDTQWYKNLLRNPTIRISARGRKGEFRAAPITRAQAVASVIHKFGRKYKARVVRKLYSKFDVAVRVRLS